MNVVPPTGPLLLGSVSPYFTTVQASSLTTPNNEYEFPSFVCTGIGYSVVHYSLSKSNTNVIPLDGGILTSPVESNGKIKIILDTQQLRTVSQGNAIEFYIYGRTDPSQDGSS